MKRRAIIDRPLVPNVETIEAMKAARRGELVTAGKSSKGLLACLNRGKADFAAFDRLMARKDGELPGLEDTLD